MKLLWTLLFATACSAQTWVIQPADTTASLRGVSAAGSRIVWASGTGGTYLKTANGGASWTAGHVPGAEALDFRDVYAIDERTAILLSSGPGDKSRIYRTDDGGLSWKLQFTNSDPKGFFDAIAFWDAHHGMVAGDPVDGHFTILTTDNGGNTWQRRTGPEALSQEGAFAASGTCLVVMGSQEAWFATGGPGGARVFHTADNAATWTVATTPIRNDGTGAGTFSLGFSDARHGMAVGGDYTKPDDATHNVAITSDGGRTWTEPSGTHPKGYRSAVVFVPGAGLWIATGTTGSDVSTDNGQTWKPFDTGAFNAATFVSGSDGWAVGPKGRIAAYR